jgi:hypothetical protein
MPAAGHSPIRPDGREHRLPQHVYRRRRSVALAALLGTCAAIALGLSSLLGGDDAASRNPSREQRATSSSGSAPLPELPRGGRTLFPAYRIVAYYGNPRAAELGVLGIGKPSHAVAELKRQAKHYVRKTRPILPTLELLATLATSSPGRSGQHRLRQPAKLIDRYLRAARAAKGLLLLDIQPGTADFLSEAKALRRWLKQPDVGLALDPEWRMHPGQVPGTVIGSVSADEVNRTSRWLAALTVKFGLPEKLFLVHQFTHGMIREREQLQPRRGLAMVLNVDGFGGREIKTAKYRDFATDRRFHTGLKLFYREDAPELMSPRQVMALQPRPDVVVYE